MRRKYCTVCRRTRDATCYYKDRTGARPDGLTAVCKDCRKARRRAILDAAHAANQAGADPIGAAVDEGTL
jgi:hypothetical protein